LAFLRCCFPSSRCGGGFECRCQAPKRGISCAAALLLSIRVSGILDRPP
jgi:hypothetical protein